MLPKVRGCHILAGGSSCREQIEQGAGRRTKHLAEMIAEAL